MMMTNDRETDRLNAAFAAARADVPVPSGGLMARILRDADAVLHETRAARAKPRLSWRRVMLDTIGDWPSLGGLAGWRVGGLAGWRVGGLAAATVAGVWIGVGSPDVLADDPPLLSGDTTEVPLWNADV